MEEVYQMLDRFLVKWVFYLELMALHYLLEEKTQAIVVATLETSDDEQRIGKFRWLQRKMCYYNFLKLGGETGRIDTSEEIGHGKLAWRAMHSSLPQKTFHTLLGVVSEITESNGSSSMAAVCGTSLALMDAGVPIKGSCRYCNGID